MKEALVLQVDNLAIYFYICVIYKMVQTRTMKKRMMSRKRSYARRLRTSPCRSKGTRRCARTRGCSYTNGKKRQYCRKSKNTKRTMKGGHTVHHHHKHHLHHLTA